jgi:hypothetical protein
MYDVITIGPSNWTLLDLSVVFHFECTKTDHIRE